MRRALIVISGVMLSGLPALAAPAPATNANGSILVLPFSVPTAGDFQWVGKAVQQDLLTDLSQGTRATVSAPASAPPAADDASALAAARDRGVAIVVYGQAQVAGKELRLTGQMLDVVTGRPLANLKATGSSDNLFHLEDAVAGQVFGAMPPTLLNAQALQAAQQPPAQSQTAPPQPAQPSSSAPTGAYAPPAGSGDYSYRSEQVDAYPASTYTSVYYPPAPVYNYVDTYPAYAYPAPCFDYCYSPYWYPSFFIGFDFGRFDRFHHHDRDFGDRGFRRDGFDRRGFDRGNVGRPFSSPGVTHSTSHNQFVNGSNRAGSGREEFSRQFVGRNSSIGSSSGSFAHAARPEMRMSDFGRSSGFHSAGSMGSFSHSFGGGFHAGSSGAHGGGGHR